MQSICDIQNVFSLGPEGRENRKKLLTFLWGAFIYYNLLVKDTALMIFIIWKDYLALTKFQMTL